MRSYELNLRQGRGMELITDSTYHPRKGHLVVQMYRYGFSFYDLCMEFVRFEFLQVVRNIARTLPKFYIIG